MEVSKESENMIKNNREFVLNNISRIHAKLAFENKTRLDFDDYILALAMFPLSISEQANMRGLSMDEIMHLISSYLETFPVKEE
tara:strand:+ start:832 stop:1083 length:252 start_codon:yes stop_codon:yes gene_type:complete